MKNFVINKILQSVGGMLAALAIYGFILTNRIEFLRQVSISVRYGFTFVLTVIFIVLFAGFNIKGLWGKWVSFILTLSIFGFPLAAMWASGAIQSESYTVAGLLPWSDASGYYTDAKLLLEGLRFSSFSSRRPLFAGLFSVLLGVSHQNLQLALAILVLVTAVACYLLAREILSTFGPLAAAFFLTLLFTYYRRYIGTTMTENLGVALGALGFTLLWNGAAHRRKWAALAGIFVVTLALNARAGPFFILPALLVWGTFSFKGQKLLSRKFLFLGIAAVIAGFLINYLVFLAIASPSGVQFSNFSYSLYGLAHGGVHWDQWQYDHPELMAIPEPQHSRLIYDYAFTEIRQNPGGLIKGIIKQWGLFFSERYVIYSVYSFLNQDNTLIGKFVRWGLYGLSILGILRWYLKREDLNSSMVVAATVGVLLSVPFVPPGDASRVRVYAAISPIFILLPMMGMQFIIEKVRIDHIFPPIDDSGKGKLAAYYSAGIIMIVIAGPILTRMISHPAQYQKIACNPGQELIYVRYSEGAYINVVEEDKHPPDWLPDLRAGQYRLLIHSLPDSKVIEILDKLQPAFTMMNGMDLQSGKSVWLVINRDMMPNEKGIIGVCGRWGEGEQEKIYWLFYAQAVEVVGK